MLKHPEPGGAKKIAAEHTKCDGVPCTKSQPAQQHSSMSSYIGGIVLQQLAPTKTDVEDDEEEDNGYKGGSEANLGEADDAAGDSNIRITDGKKLRVKEAKQAVSDYVSKVAKLGRAAR